MSELLSNHYKVYFLDNFLSDIDLLSRSFFQSSLIVKWLAGMILAININLVDAIASSVNNSMEIDISAAMASDQEAPLISEDASTIIDVHIPVAKSRTEPTETLSTVNMPSNYTHQKSSDIANSKSFSYQNNLANVAFFLTLIVGLIIGCAWLLNKTRLAGMSTSKRAILSVKHTLALGVKQKVAVIQVGQQQILVGITNQQINHLLTIDQPLESPQDDEGFQQVLKKILTKH